MSDVFLQGKFDTDVIMRYVRFLYDKFGVDAALALIKALTQRLEGGSRS